MYLAFPTSDLRFSVKVCSEAHSNSRSIHWEFLTKFALWGSERTSTSFCPAWICSCSRRILKVYQTYCWNRLLQTSQSWQRTSEVPGKLLRTESQATSFRRETLLSWHNACYTCLTTTWIGTTRQLPVEIESRGFLRLRDRQSYIKSFLHQSSVKADR